MAEGGQQGSLLLIGATARTGRLVIKEALGSGFRVTAVARKPEALADVAGPQVKVLQGDLFKPETISAAFAAAKPDVVVFCAGVASVEEAKQGPTTIYSTSAPQLVEGMAKHGVGKKQLLVVTSGGTNEDTSGEPWYFAHVLKPVLAQMYDDMKKMEKVILDGQASAGYSYVLVRPTYLVNDELRSPTHPRAMIVADGVNPKASNSIVGRGDVAQFIVQKCALGDEWLGKAPVLSYRTWLTPDMDNIYAQIFGCAP